MQLDLYPIIQPLISSYHRLYVSGLGTFSEKYIAAKEDSINGKICLQILLLYLNQVETEIVRYFIMR